MTNRDVTTQNVTYGYTGASFSGRMPCVEIADSIVQTGRETLEKVCAILLHGWHAVANAVLSRPSSKSN